MTTGGFELQISCIQSRNGLRMQEIQRDSFVILIYFEHDTIAINGFSEEMLIWGNLNILTQKWIYFRFFLILHSERGQEVHENISCFSRKNLI